MDKPKMFTQKTRDGIRFFRGRRGILTTLEAANQALGIGQARQESLARLEF